MSVKQVSGYLQGMQQDRQSVTKDWESLQPLIEGVRVREMRSVVKENGCLTELYRDDWEGMTEVRHVFQETLIPGECTAWHLHAETTDRLFVAMGWAKIVLYDAREGSRTRGLLNVFRFGTSRHGLVVIPPGIWHGVMNIGDEPALLMNLADQAYAYEAPDHWRLPVDTEQIPYCFSKDAAGRL
jgi:dTDP-4-dehydrorhamnose 3,5-epimerase